MTNNNTCEIYCYDEEKVNRIQENMKKADIVSIAKVFKIIGDKNRAKITYALCQDDELCVCDIANIIGATIATTSHHLRNLYKSGIVKFRKEGKLAFYSIDDQHIRQLINIALEHNREVRVHV
ncbi:ArsR/SmtB family transcription factor [Priestia megaterium]|uniref:ArsR/SmtB family transcription factor n=1 Tax=Priestia megaterium TaxID=1404 RepID=UPI00076280EF|nr:metalloregulator ArsR/SmtB family transcription factor [Priestia megaterium]KWU59990.1 ArsR family transcriptional regulator [Priestia megaterium]